MKNAVRLTLLVMLVCGVLVGSSTAQDDPATLFTLATEDPIISPSEDTNLWDGRYTDPGAVLYHDGKFHMLRNGFNGWPASVQMGYLYSEDGITWTEDSEEPVLYTDEVPYAETAALASSLLVDEMGTWVLYFYTWNSPQANTGGEIGRATAPDPAGPWTVDPEPVLTVGGEGAWDSMSVSAPSVVATADGYAMYYAGSALLEGGNPNTAIGLATSPDGITWTKYDDPATTDSLYAESDPVVTAFNEEQWFVHQPRVVATPQGLVMVLRSMDQAGAGTMKLYYATSEDGITWTVADGAPVWAVDSFPGRRGKNFWWTALAYDGDNFYLYIEGQERLGTHIFVATHMGALPPAG